MTVLGKQEDLQRGSLDVLSNIDDLLDTRDSECDVLGRDTGIMEGVKGHLSGGLTYGLSGNGSNHLTRVGNGLIEARPDFTNHPVERMLSQPLSLNHRFGVQHRPQIDLKEPGGVLPSLQNKWISSDLDAWDGREVLKETFQRLEHMARVQISYLAILDLELLLGVPDDSLEIDREMDIVIALTLENNVSEIITILLELVELVLKHHLHMCIISDLLCDIRE